MWIVNPYGGLKNFTELLYNNINNKQKEARILNE